MTMEPREAQQPAKAPFFKGAFFWYVVLQVSFLTTATAVLFVYFFAAGYLYPEEVDGLLAQVESFDTAGRVVRFAVMLVLCILVSARHELGFWRGVGLFVAGNIVSSLIYLPIVGLGMYGDNHPSMTWVSIYGAVIAGYAFVCGYLIVRQRRKMLTRKRQRDVVEVFD